MAKETPNAKQERPAWAKGAPAATPSEIIPPSESEAGALIRSGEALVRLENDTQMSIALQRPRNEKEILDQALQELEAYPRAAEEAIYHKPVGKDPETGEQKIAEGLSIRAAESLANRWRNSAYGAQVLSEDDDGADIVATFVDYETNTRAARPMRISKWYKPAKSTQMRKINEERFHSVVLQAAMSKLLREVVLRKLPAGLKLAYYEKATAVIRKGAKSDLKGSIVRMLKAYKKLGVEEAKLLAYLKVEDLAQITADQVVDLRGVYNAIEAGEQTAAEVFNGPQEATGKSAVAGAPDAAKLFGEEEDEGQEGAEAENSAQGSAGSPGRA